MSVLLFSLDSLVERSAPLVRLLQKKAKGFPSVDVSLLQQNPTLCLDNELDELLGLLSFPKEDHASIIAEIHGLPPPPALGGTVELLRRLKASGATLGCMCGPADAGSLAALASVLDFVWTSDCDPRSVAKEHGVPMGKVVFVGSAAEDYTLAAEAGAHFVMCGYGTRGRQLKAAGLLPASLAEDTSALERRVESLLARNILVRSGNVLLTAMCCFLGLCIMEFVHDGERRILHLGGVVVESVNFPYLMEALSAGAIFLLLLTTPITHVFVGTRQLYYTSWQPFRGGKMFLFFTSVGWILYALAVVLALRLAYVVLILDTLYDRYLLFGIGGAGLLSQVCISHSLGFFEPPPELIRPRRRAKSVSYDHEYFDVNSEHPWFLDGRWNSIGALTLMMAILSAVAIMFIEFLPRWSSYKEGSFFHPSVQLGMFAVLCLLACAPITHWVVGSRRYHENLQLRGNTVFMTLQFLGWAFYGLTIAFVLLLMYLLVSNVIPWSGLLAVVGLSGMCANVLLLISLEWYSSRRRFRRTSNLSDDEVAEVQRVSLRGLLMSFMDLNITSFIYGFPFVLISGMAAVTHAMGYPYAVISWGFFAAFSLNFKELFWVLVGMCFAVATPSTLVLAAFCIVYEQTYRRAATREEQPALRSPLLSWFWDGLARYFSYRVIGHGKLDPDQTYMLGFHPHGVYPYSLVWGPLSAPWRARYPRVDLRAVTASVVFAVPGLRDIAFWMGAQEATKEAIGKALENKKSLVIVPGGQAEMRLLTANRNTLNVLTRHKGFVKMAIKAGVPLVPLYSFGEECILYNVEAPAIQKWTCKKLGFALPHFPYGRWYTPLPCAHPLTLVVGSPIPVKKNENPTDAEIAELHTKYFTALKELFYEYRASAGFPDAELTLCE